MPYYVINSKNQVVVRCDHSLNEEDLATRGEFVIIDSRNLDILKIEAQDNKLVSKKKSIRDQIDEAYNKKSDIDGLIDHYTRKKLRILIEKHDLADKNLKDLWTKRDILAKKEDDLSEHLGEREDARMHRLQGDAS